MNNWFNVVLHESFTFIWILIFWYSGYLSTLSFFQYFSDSFLISWFATKYDRIIEKKLYKYPIKKSNIQKNVAMLAIISYFRSNWPRNGYYLLCKVVDLHHIRPCNRVLHRTNIGLKYIFRQEDIGMVQMPYILFLEITRNILSDFW